MTQHIKAAWAETHYRHFGIIEEFSNLYGVEIEDIKTVRVEISEDQEELENQVKGVPDYWGYFDIKQDKFTFIFPSLIQLKVCSPDFWKSDLREGKGKLLRIEVYDTEKGK